MRPRTSSYRRPWSCANLARRHHIHTRPLPSDQNHGTASSSPESVWQVQHRSPKPTPSMDRPCSAFGSCFFAASFTRGFRFVPELAARAERFDCPRSSRPASRVGWSSDSSELVSGGADAPFRYWGTYRRLGVPIGPFIKLESPPLSMAGSPQSGMIALSLPDMLIQVMQMHDIS